MERLERLMGQDLEVDQIKQALCLSNSRLGRPPSIRQLSEVMFQDMLPGLPRPSLNLSDAPEAWSPSLPYKGIDPGQQLPMESLSSTSSWSDPEELLEDAWPSPSDPSRRKEGKRFTPSVPALKLNGLHGSSSVSTFICYFHSMGVYISCMFSFFPAPTIVLLRLKLLHNQTCARHWIYQ